MSRSKSIVGNINSRLLIIVALNEVFGVVLNQVCIRLELQLLGILVMVVTGVLVFGLNVSLLQCRRLVGLMLMLSSP